MSTPFRRLLMLVATAASVAAQSPLTTTFAGGQTGGAVYFQLTCTDPAGITITSFDLLFATPAGTSGSIGVWLKCEDAGPVDSFNWIFRDQAAVVSAGPAVPTHCTLAFGIRLSFEQTVGVCIGANVVRHEFSQISPTIPRVYATAELTLTAGLASAIALNGPGLPDRVVDANVHYTSGGIGLTMPCAQTFGQSCGGLLLKPATPSQLGTPPFTFHVRTEGIPWPPPGGSMHFGVAGFDVPNASLAAYSLPGCTWYARADVVYVSTLFLPFPTLSWSPFGFGGGIPPDPTLAGCRFFVQSAVIGTGTNAGFGGIGAVVSNGIEFTLGWY
ncbi:MAG TPA: hypothetical protein VFZ65_08275 [Planctomycetota bacterium]|nr:hypothetical protein [Planctomycetota bacterium]